MYRLCVLPNEPISALVKKGSIRKRYFNPGEVFDEVHIISPKKDVVEASVLQMLVGRAKVVMHDGNYNLRKCLVPSVCEATARRLADYIVRLSPNVIRAYNPTTAGFLACLVGRRLGVPVVVSVHTDYWRDLALNEGLFALNPARFCYYAVQDRLIAPRVLRSCKAVICKYQFVYEWARNRGARNALLVYNQVDVERFRCLNREFIPRTEPRILTVGRLERIKRIDLIIRALAISPGTLTIVGEGPERFRLEKLASRLNVTERVGFIGAVVNSDLPFYYHNADIFCSATYAGGVGVVMLEAMAAGLPLVLTKTRWGSCREIAEGAAIITEPTPEGLASGFATVARDPVLQERLSVYGYKTVSSLNGEEGEARAYLTILTESRNELE